jgi:ReqiPepy6 Gp37-like protein
MPIDTSLIFTDGSGNHLFETKQFLDIGNAPGLHYVLSCGKVGALTVTLPPDFNSLLPKDGRIHVMRSVNGAPAQREGESCYLIRRWDYADDYTVVTALHANSILWRRFGLWGYYTRAAETSTAITADDTIKSGGAGGNAMWADNFGANAASGNRNDGNITTQSDISAYVSVAADVGAAPVVYQQWYWQSIGDAVLNICDGSFAAGAYLVAEIVAPTESTLELRTYTGQRGQDRRFSTGNGLLFTSSRGNFANAILTVDATNEVTVAVAGGPQRDSGLEIRGSVDTARIAESPLNRIEAFVDDGGGTNTDINAIQADADAAVRAGRPVIQARGNLVDTDTCVRGVDYNFGDLVTVEVRGIQYDMRVDLLDVTITQAVETTRAGFFYNG